MIGVPHVCPKRSRRISPMLRDMGNPWSGDKMQALILLEFSDANKSFQPGTITVALKHSCVLLCDLRGSSPRPLWFKTLPSDSRLFERSFRQLFWDEHNVRSCRKTSLGPRARNSRRLNAGFGPDRALAKSRLFRSFSTVSIAESIRPKAGPLKPPGEESRVQPPLHFGLSRCTTFTRYPALRKYFPTSSAIITDRCCPPVHPNPIVR